MPRGPNKGVLGMRSGEPDGVADLACHDLVIANQASEYGQTSGVGRGPSGGAQSIRQQIEDGAGAALPTGCLWICRIDFVKDAVIGIHRDRVAISCTGASAFDRGVEWDSVRPRVALALISKSGRIFGLCSQNRHIGNSDGGA